MNFFNLSSDRNENPIKMADEIRLYIHEDLHIVKCQDYGPNTTLNEYLRNISNLTGTKVMCREGGCGSCTVVAIVKHPVTNKEQTFAVFSCLVSIFSCDGWRIVTVEGLKSPKSGYHKIQRTLVEYNGTQCGFCTSGMVMMMYNLSQKKNLTKAEIENSFGGNICRCTGYRPILEGFKSLASAVNISDGPDIEDVPSCPLKDELEEFTHLFPINTTAFGLNLNESIWYKVFSINEIFQLFQKFPAMSYRLVAGNTARGVYKKDTERDLYIDIMNVKELQEHDVSLTKLEMGANMSLNEAMDVFRSVAKLYKNFKYLDLLADHIDLVATVPIRNIGSLAGNLSIKHEHNEFPSDIFLILETVKATLTIVSKDKSETVSLLQYLKMDMKYKIIKKITLPPLDTSYFFNSYKIMPRAQNAHAIVNAGFLIKLDHKASVTEARIVYGGINPKFVHAEKLESFVKGKNLFDNDILQQCFKTLDDELKPDYVLPDPKPEFRKGLAIALFYKFILSSAPQYMVTPRYVSGGKKLIRPISVGTQEIGSNASMYPVTQPIPKIEAYAQVSGEAKYVIDHPDQPNQLFVALVLAKAPAYSTISKIDASKALKLKGVVAFYTAKDIPGENAFSSYLAKKEKIFADKTIEYYSQPVGMVVADSQKLAENAADLVEVSYVKSSKKPLLTIRDILTAGAKNKIVADTAIARKSKGDNVKYTIEGTYYAHMQYHFHMETQSCNVIPVEDGLEVFPTTQWMDLVQSGISVSCNIPSNKINIKVRRLGGAYGAKITRNNMPSCQAALAAHLLQRPVKIWLPLETNMNALGKRFPCYATYKVAVNEKGVIQYLDITAYMDFGAGEDINLIRLLLSMILNGYKTDTFNIDTFRTYADITTNTSCRAPGSNEGLGLIESIMEHISYTINVDPLAVRMANWDNEKHSKLPEFLKDFLKETDIDNRKNAITQFNKDNRWRKKGLSIVTMAFQYEVIGNWNVYISVYHLDGTVAIAHGGIEMGQGINTKVAQVCAYCLGIPLEMVQVKPSNNLVSPNNFTSGGSATSESVCYAVIKATEILKNRMEPVKQSMKEPTWLKLVQACYDKNIPLTGTYSFNPDEVKPYTIYGLCATEVEVDILTGNHLLTRVDILEDVGESMSPLVDVGQVEGAFIMGIGYWTTEELIMGPDGELKTNRTWNYKPPGAKDIPIDFRVKFPKNSNPVGVFKSKATGEPSLCMGCCVPFAIRRALNSARQEADSQAIKWIPMDGPTTVETTFLNSLNNYTQYKL